MSRATAEKKKDNGSKVARKVNGVIPFILGGCLTAVFYAALPYLPFQRELATRYFCSHPLAYCTAALFFTAIASLLTKLWASLPERRAVSGMTLDAAELAALDNDVNRAARLRDRIEEMPAALRHSTMAQRLREVVEFVRGRRSSDGLQEHLKYLAELASERLHQSYAMVRTVTWAIPILGFLGTVIGITMAIANVTPEQLETSLGSVTSGLAVAFDTTALALALSIVLVFITFLVERVEQRVASSIEEFGIANILPAFPTQNNQGGSVMSVQQESAQRLIDATEQLIDRQMDAWSEHMSAMRERWTASLDEQQESLEKSLVEGVGMTLESHSAQLEEARGTLAEQIESATLKMSEHFERLQDRHESQVDASRDQMETFWGRLQQEAEEVQQWQAESRRDMTVAAREIGEEWSKAVRDASEASQEQLVELQRQAELLARVIEEEENLGRLQQSLNENLTAVRAAESFEETLHSLNAAVHMLTTRVRPKAA